MLGELLGVVALFSAGSWVASLVGRDQRLRRAAEKLPVTAMRDAVEGRPVKVMGIVDLPRPPLVAPISGRGCAGWAVDLQEEGDGWQTVLTEWHAEDFVIVDETGHAARIVVAKAELVYELDAAATASWSEPPSERVRAFLARHGRRPAGPFAAGAYRCCEGIIEHGERVTVVGVARRELDPSPRAVDGSYREAPMRLVFDAADGPLLIFDGPARWRAR